MSPKVRLPTARWMSMAARTAAQAWFSQASGMLKEANRPSPMKVLTTPPWARIGSSTVSRYSFSAATSSSGARYSAMVVKPAMSVNRMVASRDLAGQHALALALQDGGGDALVDIAAEGLAEALALAQALDHVVELAGELADLVVGGDRHALAEVARGDLAHGVATGCGSAAAASA